MEPEMNLKGIFLTESFHDHDYYTNFGMEIVEDVDISGYSLVLLKFDRSIATVLNQMGASMYQLAIEREGMDFTNLIHQQQTGTINRDVRIMSSIRDIKRMIGSWIDQYGNISIGTYNEKKREQYRRLLSMMGFDCAMIDTKHILGIDLMVISK